MSWLVLRWRALVSLLLAAAGAGVLTASYEHLPSSPGFSGASWSLDPLGVALSVAMLGAAALLLARRL